MEHYFQLQIYQKKEEKLKNHSVLDMYILLFIIDQDEFYYCCDDNAIITNIIILPKNIKPLEYGLIEHLFTAVGEFGNGLVLYVTYDYPSQLDPNMIQYTNQLDDKFQSLISFKDYNDYREYKDGNIVKLLFDHYFIPGVEYKITCEIDFDMKVVELERNSLQYKCYANSSFGQLIGYICRYNKKNHLFFHLKNDRIKGYHFVQTSDGYLEDEEGSKLKSVEKSELKMLFGLSTKYEGELHEKRGYLIKSKLIIESNFYIEITSIKETDNFQVLLFGKEHGTNHTCLYCILFYIYLIKKL